jgi:hypothetical protein
MIDYWKSGSQITVWRHGTLAARPATPDSVNHAYLATDQEQVLLSISVDDGAGGRIWREVALNNLVGHIDFDTGYTPGDYTTGRMYWDSANQTITIEMYGSEVRLQVGQEIHARVANETGMSIPNGTPIRYTGVSTDGYPNVEPAQAHSDPETRVSAMTTEAIADGTTGYVTRFGLVRELDTDAFAAGARVYLSATVAGDLVATPPSEPSYQRTVGACLVSHASEGVIFCLPTTIQTLNDLSEQTQNVLDITNGSCLQNPDVTITESGGTVYCNVERTGGGDIMVKFDDDLYDWDCTPADSVALVAGSDISPTRNYVYLLESTKTLTANQSGWPATEHVPIADILCQSAPSVALYGVYKMHAWTDHTKDAAGMGHIAHLNSWIRSQHATWIEGVAQTLTITPGSPDTVIFSTTSGKALQLHLHTVPAFLSGSPEYYEVNNSATPYNRITDLASCLNDSAGASLSGRYFSLVLWIVVSEAASDCKMFAALPSGSYNTAAQLLLDEEQYANFTLPPEFKGCAFLVSELKLRHQTSGGGTWTSIEEIDLRGLFPAITAGGGAISGSEFYDNVFLVRNVADNTKAMALDVSDITTGTTRTFTIPDKSGTFALLSDFSKRATHWHDESTVVNGNALARVVDARAYYTYSYQNASADADAFSFAVWLAPGTYTFYVLGETNANCGIIDWDFDSGDDAITGQDWYTAGQVTDVEKSGAITLTVGGYIVVTGTINGKHGSSGGHNMKLTKMWIKPTTD